MRAHRTGLTVVLLALSAGACGGGPSASEWRERADMICREARADLAARERRTGRVTSAQVVSRYRSALAALRGLEPSERQAVDAARLIAALEERVEVVEELGRRFQPSEPLTPRDDAALGDLAARGDRAAAETRRHARALELRECGAP